MGRQSAIVLFVSLLLVIAGSFRIGDIPEVYGACFNPTFAKNTIITTASNARSVYAVDVDGDTDIDILSASYNDDTVAWYENDGGTFTERIITTSADAAMYVRAADIDGDTDIDVVGASLLDDTISWYENSGSESFTKRDITTSADGARSVYPVDVDGDTDIDLVSASFEDDTVAWYENDGSENFTKRTITSTANGVNSVYAVDIDGDADIDVVAASFQDDTVAWYENSGSESFTKHSVDTVDGAWFAYADDVDDDGDVDLLSAAYNADTVSWYDNDGSENFTKKSISNTANGPNFVHVADVDDDGDNDVISTSYDDDTVTWYENDGSESFTKRDITTSANGATSAYPGDFDGDGDMDIATSSGLDNTIAWYEQICDTTNPTVSTFSPADNATGVSTTANLVITFDEAVDAESGASNDIIIKKASDDSTVESIDAQDAKVTGSGSATITINPATTLDEQTEYYVQIGADAFDDLDGNSYAGISDTTSWSFTTADETAPTVSILSPADNATGVSITANLVITFDEAVDAESGASNDIVIKKTSDNSTVESIDAQDAKVTGSGSTTITINPATTLDGSTEYYIQIGADTFDDVAGNSYAGILDTTSWSFTTKPAPTVSSISPDTGALGGGTVVTITGTGFSAGATAALGGSNCGSLSVDSATSITCTTTAHAAGAVDVVVTNPDAQAGTLSNGYTYTSGNSAPTATTPNTITQATDGTGYVTFKTTISDPDTDITQLKVEYSTGSSWSDPTIGNVSSSQGDVGVTNSNVYQISSIDTDTGSITLTIIWKAKEQLDNTQENSVRLRVTPYDGTAEGDTKVSESFSVDTKAPAASSFQITSQSTTTATLSWTPGDTDSNFDSYAICYGTSQDQANACTYEWSTANDASLSTQTANKTTIANLLSSTAYSFILKLQDTFGNLTQTSSIAGTTTTAATPTPTAAPTLTPTLSPTPLPFFGGGITPTTPRTTTPPATTEATTSQSQTDSEEEVADESDSAQLITDTSEEEQSTTAVFGVARQAARAVRQTAKVVSQSPAAKVVTTTAAITAPVTIAASANTLSAIPSLMGQVTSATTRLLQALIGLLGFRGKRRPWGRVVDANTGTPVPNAIIYVISRERGKVIETLKSDTDGSFSAFVPPGTYDFKVVKDGWELVPDAAVPQQQADEQIYAGRPVTVTEETLVKVVFALQQEETQASNNLILKTILQRAEYYLQRLSWPLLFFGLVLSTVILIGDQSALNISIEVFYLLLIAFKYFVEHRFQSALGSIADANTGKPLDLASVRLYDAETNKLVTTQVTSRGGKFLLKAKPGVYTLMAVRAGYQAYKEAHVIIRSESKPLAMTIPLTPTVPQQMAVGMG